jgi:hypothetical protein
MPVDVLLIPALLGFELIFLSHTRQEFYEINICLPCIRTVSRFYVQDVTCNKWQLSYTPVSLHFVSSEIREVCNIVKHFHNLRLLILVWKQKKRISPLVYQIKFLDRIIRLIVII